MKSTIMKFICKYGARLCAVALAVAPLASEACKMKYYQPEEPEGLRDFAMKR
jgi:cyclic lactone autoinducer peptide